MRETFPREAAADPEPFTGERLTASIHGQVEIEHYHRYLYARGFCRDRDVLDVASGEGYGAAQLAQVARFVVGVEYSGPTTRHAAASFRRLNLRFVQADARSLPLDDACFDVVTSFETIEHFDRQDEFIAEVRRVLRAEGCFIVSTPDRDVYSPPGSAPNPFHVQEFDRAGFLAALHQHFRYVTLIRQRPFVASGLIPEEVASIAPAIFERSDDATFAADTALLKAPYLIAIASELAPRVAPVSLLIEHSDIDNVRVADQEAALSRVSVAEAAMREAEGRLRESEDRLRESEDRLRASEAAARHRLEAERETARQVLEAEREAARLAAERAETDAQTAAESLLRTQTALAQANSDLDRIGGSARQFLVQYIPRLWRHVAR
jgi:ubiquinone/menaquinone biosynthesis C-methylase UbiE